MRREFLFAKLHHAVVTECLPEYSGSVTIDRDLLDAVGLLPNERVLIADCENGNRFETYVFEGARGSGTVAINGAAALLSGVGHRVIVIAFCELEAGERAAHRPRVAVCDDRNRVAELIDYPACVLAPDAAPAAAP